VDGTFAWTDGGPRRRRYSDTVIYEVHVKGFTMRHPGVPAELRGTYAGFGHEAAVGYLTDLGVTAVELLPVHQNVRRASCRSAG
jgi:isoamylase